MHKENKRANGVSTINERSTSAKNQLMSSQLIANLLDNLISILGGTLATLYGFRILGATEGTNPRWDQWYNGYGKHLKWLGPLVIAFGIGMALSSAFAN